MSSLCSSIAIFEDGLYLWLLGIRFISQIETKVARPNRGDSFISS